MAASGRMRTTSVSIVLVLPVASLALMPEASGNHETAHQDDQGLTDPGEEQVFSEALPLLIDNPNVDTVVTMRDGSEPLNDCPLSGRVY